MSGRDLHEVAGMSATATAVLQTELPFWLMVPSCRVLVPCAGRDHPVRIRDDFSELHLVETTDSRIGCVYSGARETLTAEFEAELEETGKPTLWRRSKTVVQIESICPCEFFERADKDHEARAHLQALCAAHIPIINKLIQRYRVATYDYFVFAVSPWDVPVWFVTVSGEGKRIVLGDYHTWDEKPALVKDDVVWRYQLIDPDELSNALASATESPGELELLDSLNLMERGDYAGAVRRMATALEVIVESVLEQELSKLHDEAEVSRRLDASRNDFPGRCRQYCKLARRVAPDWLERTLEDIREARHKIVHEGLRIGYAGRGPVQKRIDTGRWAYNWFENDEAKAKVRESHIAKRSLGRFMPRVEAELQADRIGFH